VLKRPAWYFDVQQQGEGIVDVTTHLIDLVQWECFPGQKLDYHKNIQISGARRWPTIITPQQFTGVTRLQKYPDYLHRYIVDDSLLYVYANGEIVYKIKGIWAKVAVEWNYRAPEGGGDTYYSVMKGTKAGLIIRQGKEQNYRPELYVKPVAGTDRSAFAATLQNAMKTINKQYSAITLKKLSGMWQVIIPQKYRLGHEAHFGQMLAKYLNYLVQGKLPDWEVPNMLAKYYTTTTALQIAKKATLK
ncbi:MAG TPA: oxidoreductase, partial [Bacteroidetes bacterium]|nr:oxidoreductase [Bacteroidota bacterium]